MSYLWDVEALGLFLSGAASGYCFCVAVLVCEHEDPLTRTASK